MTPTDRIPVIPEVLTWARESAGLTPTRAAKLIGVSETTLSRWEAGETQPTIRQLRTAAAKYHRPLAVLLLPEPPRDFDAMRDFRRVALLTGPAWSPQLHAEYRRALSQREVMLELAEVSPASVSASPDPPHIPADDPEAAGDVLRALLGLDVTKPDWGRSAEALKAAIESVERLGVLVVQTQRVRSDEMQGFSVAEWPFPIIALNGGDPERRRLFTLMHELAHLATNAAGLCDLHEEAEDAARPEDRVERACNQVAAAILMPRRELLSLPAVSTAAVNHAWSLDELGQLGKRFGPSSEAVLLRLVQLGRASWDLYWQRKAEFRELYAAAEERERQRRRESPGGPSWYVLHARDLGHGYVASVLDAYYARAISSLDVSDYLDVRFDRLEKLERVVYR